MSTIDGGTLRLRKGKALGPLTIQDYGKYGKYQKQENGKWKRLKSGYPQFRKTLNYKLMKMFLLVKGENESFLNKHGVKTLRSLIKSKSLSKEYEIWLEENNGEVRNEK